MSKLSPGSRPLHHADAMRESKAMETASNPGRPDRRAFLSTLILGLGCLPVRPRGDAMKEPQYRKKSLIAHRGASAYAPENTLPAYRLAVEQGADIVEQDLQVTRDGVLVCLHDQTLERTTDVEQVYPDRYREERTEGDVARRWPVADFTWEEIQRLDAGSWFDAKYAHTRIPSWQEAIDAIRGRAGLFPETKAPEVYGALGWDMERLVQKQLEQSGLAQPGADPRTPVIIQSFSAASLKKMARELKSRLPLVLLVGAGDPVDPLEREQLEEVATYAAGIGPAKELIGNDPSIVGRAHEAGLSVTCWTFRMSGHAQRDSLRHEMETYLYTHGIDALFTDNPDLFPRE